MTNFQKGCPVLKCAHCGRDFAPRNCAQKTCTVACQFWSKVEKTEGCWLWTGCFEHKGYGSIKINGTSRRAHRVSYELAFGEVPRGMHVLHKCDNPSCVRPDHLFVGTNLDNVRDRDQKNRQAKGERAGNWNPSSYWHGRKRGVPFRKA